MQGTVRLINLKRGMIAVETEDGSYTVLELLAGYEVGLGDDIKGNLHSLGGEKIQNRSTGESLDVYVQAFHATLANAKQLLK